MPGLLAAYYRWTEASGHNGIAWSIGPLTVTPWDLATILLGLLLIGQAWATQRKARTRRGKAILVWSAVLGTCGLLIDGSLIEPQRLTVRTEVRQIPSWPASWHFRFGVLADIHIGPTSFRRPLREAVAALNGANVDAVLIPGDFVAHADVSTLSDLRALAELHSRWGTYAVLGNHDFVGSADGRRRLLTELAASHVHVVSDTTVSLGDGLSLIGIKSLWTGHGDINRAVASCVDPSRAVAMVHEPDAFPGLAAHHVPLVIAAHTHGGQIRLPLIGTVMPVHQLVGRSTLPFLDRRHQDGWFSQNNSDLFITAGLGTSGPRARLFCPPEVVIMTLSGTKEQRVTR